MTCFWHKHSVGTTRRIHEMDLYKYTWFHFKKIKRTNEFSDILTTQNKESKEPKYLIYNACDAGRGLWIGQSMLHTIRPSWFCSWIFKPEQPRYPTFQKELLAIIDSLHLFEAQLRGHKFIILTDYKVLLTFM